MGSMADPEIDVLDIKTINSLSTHNAGICWLYNVFFPYE